VAARRSLRCRRGGKNDWPSTRRSVAEKARTDVKTLESNTTRPRAHMMMTSKPPPPGMESERVPGSNSTAANHSREEKLSARRGEVTPPGSRGRPERSRLGAGCERTNPWPGLVPSESEFRLVLEQAFRLPISAVMADPPHGSHDITGRRPGHTGAFRMPALP